MNQKAIGAGTHEDRSDGQLCEVKEACRQAMVGIESVGKEHTSNHKSMEGAPQTNEKNAVALKIKGHGPLNKCD